MLAIVPVAIGVTALICGVVGGCVVALVQRKAIRQDYKITRARLEQIEIDQEEMQADMEEAFLSIDAGQTSPRNPSRRR